MTELALPAASLPFLFGLPGSEHIVAGLQRAALGIACQLTVHRFPDGEACPRFDRDLAGRDVVLVAVLDRPDDKLFALYLCASVARELGARSVGLVLPYLPYMRQDTRFRPGEGTSARHVARLLSSCADWLATVDPHLHRFLQLDAVYTVPALAVPSAQPLAQWIRAQVADPVIVGPDSESAQWVVQVAAMLDCPWAVMAKDRQGDRNVSVALAGGALPAGRTPVLMDDIASSGHTMAAAIAQLRSGGAPAPVCIVVHALFADDALAVIERAGPARIVSCNTIGHPSNAIDVCPPLAAAATQLLQGLRRPAS